MTDSHDFRRIVCTSCGATFDVPVPCGNRFCDICNQGRKNRIRSKLEWLVAHVDKPRGYSVKHVTLTCRNMDSLSDMLDLLTQSFRKLRQRALWKNCVDGGAFVIEVTGNPGDWHAHIHAVIMAKFLPWKQVVKAWKQISDSTGVYITRIPGKAVVAYLTKYITKTDLSPEFQYEASSALKGRRLYQPFGSWHSLSNNAPKHKPTCSKCGESNFMLLDLVFRDDGCSRQIKTAADW